MSQPFLRSIRIACGMALLASTACANQPTQSVDRGTPSQPPTPTVAVPEAAAPVARTVAPLALSRQLHAEGMHEVILDPRAEAALTLDRKGGVRLWTELGGDGVRAPVVLPEQEPAWLSLAQADDGYVVGFIDTAGAGRVARVEVDDAGARSIPLFELPATDPLFELHVLDGGERILVLGIDHRVRLYDRSGAELSVVDDMGFVPWQLRVQQTPGRAPSIVAVLAGPTRVQPLRLDGDRLSIDGEARRVVIDQGPNRNDLSLSPDGTTVTALRRPKARGRRFTLELVDLATDQRRLIAAEIDTRERPRVHLVDGERILLESGSGRGFWVEQSAAIPWTEGTSREETEDVPAVALTEVELPASTLWHRVHATVVHGVRAVPDGHTLVIDPLDESSHWVLGAEPLIPGAVALDGTGQRVAWSTAEGIVVESTEDVGERRELPAFETPVVELAFLGDDRLLALATSGHAAILGDDGQVQSRVRLPVGWGMSGAGFHRGGAEGQGVLGLLPSRPKDPIHVVEVLDGAFGEPQDVPRYTRSRWPEMGARARDARGVVDTLGFEDIDAGSIAALVEDGRGHHLIASDASHPMLWRVSESGTTELLLREGRVQRLVPEPEGSRVAVLQRTRSAAVDQFVISVIDLESGDRAWARPMKGVRDLDWSGDGQRLAVVGHEGAQVIEADDGDVVFSRRHGDLKATRVGE